MPATTSSEEQGREPLHTLGRTYGCTYVIDFSFWGREPLHTLGRTYECACVIDFSFGGSNTTWSRNGLGIGLPDFLELIYPTSVEPEPLEAVPGPTRM